MESTQDIFAYFFAEGALPVEGVDVPLDFVHDQLLLFLPRSVLPTLGKNFQSKGETFSNTHKSGVTVFKTVGLFFEEKSQKLVELYLLHVLNN